METLEHRLKFGHGLTIGTHAVLLRKGDQTRVALVRIPSRGRPRLTVANQKYIVTSVVDGDHLITEGSRAFYVYQSEWAEKTASPVLTIDI